MQSWQLNLSYSIILLLDAVPELLLLKKVCVCIYLPVFFSDGRENLKNKGQNVILRQFYCTLFLYALNTDSYYSPPTPDFLEYSALLS